MCLAIKPQQNTSLNQSYLGFKTESEQECTSCNILDSALPTNYILHGSPYKSLKVV
jgi:hypothetical protein